jgi:hypothetical protein
MRKALTRFVVNHRPCSTNQGYNIVGKRLYKNKKAKAYHDAIQAACPYKGPVYNSGRFRVEIDFYFAVPISDIDGPVKFTLDALEGIIFKNDKLVYSLGLKKNIDRKNPRATIRVYKLKDPPQKKKTTKKTKQKAKK